MDLSGLFTIGASWPTEIIYTLCLTILGWIYSLVSYCFRLFSLMCQINFTSLYSIVAPLIDRLEAVVMVLIMFKGGIALITYLMNPEKALSGGKDLLKNIAIVIALLMTYNYIFGFLNEISMLIIGYQEGYEFTILPDFIDVEDADEGLISRFIFGSTEVDTDLGDFVAYKTVSIFVRNEDGTMENKLVNSSNNSQSDIDFNKLSDLAPYVGKTVEYTAVAGTIIGIYMIYMIIKTTIEIGIRMFKLIVLQLLAPVAIISIIRGGVKDKIFSDFKSIYFKTYLDAFIRMASMLILIVLISKFFINIGSFFSESAFGTDESTLTECFLMIIIVVAGFKFVSELPKFIDSILGTHTADNKNNFGKYISGLAGLAVGGGVGLATGIATDVRTGTFGSGLANMVSGQVQGFQAGSKGNNIIESIKNINAANKKTSDRANDWTNRGGFGAVAGGAIGANLGVKSSQDRKMDKYDKMLAAFDAYDSAQTEAISNIKMSEIKNTPDFINYSDGYDGIKFGDDKDSYVSKMLEFDKSYQDAKVHYEKLASSDSTDEAVLADAQRDLLAAREKARSHANDIYDKYKNNANSDYVKRTRDDLDKIASEYKENGKYDIKNAKNKINEEKRKLAHEDSYKNTHSGGGSKK